MKIIAYSNDFKVQGPEKLLQSFNVQKIFEMDEVLENEHFLVFLTPCICKTGAVFLTMISQELGKASN